MAKLNKLMEAYMELVEISPGMAGRAAEEARKRGQFNRARAIQYLSKKADVRRWKAGAGTALPPNPPPATPFQAISGTISPKTVAKGEGPIYKMVSKLGRYKYPLAGAIGATALAGGAYKLGKSKSREK